MHHLSWRTTLVVMALTERDKAILDFERMWARRRVEGRRYQPAIRPLSGPLRPTLGRFSPIQKPSNSIRLWSDGCASSVTVAAPSISRPDPQTIGRADDRTHSQKQWARCERGMLAVAVVIGLLLLLKVGDSGTNLWPPARIPPRRSTSRASAEVPTATAPPPIPKTPPRRAARPPTCPGPRRREDPGPELRWPRWHGESHQLHHRSGVKPQ